MWESKATKEFEVMPQENNVFLAWYTKIAKYIGNGVQMVMGWD